MQRLFTYLRRRRIVPVLNFNRCVSHMIESIQTRRPLTFDIAQVQCTDPERVVLNLLESFRTEKKVIVSENRGLFQDAAFEFIQTFIDPEPKHDFSRDFNNFPADEAIAAEAVTLLQDLRNTGTWRRLNLVDQLPDREFNKTVEQILHGIRNNSDLKCSIGILHQSKLIPTLKYKGRAVNKCSDAQIALLNLLHSVKGGQAIKFKSNIRVYDVMQNFLRKRVNPELEPADDVNFPGCCVNNLDHLKDVILGVEAHLAKKAFTRHFWYFFSAVLATAMSINSFMLTWPSCNGKDLEDAVEHLSNINHIPFDNICENDNDYAIAVLLSLIFLYLTNLVIHILGWINSPKTLKIKRSACWLLLMAFINVIPLIFISIYYDEAGDLLGSSEITEEAVAVIKPKLKTPGVFPFVAFRVLAYVSLIIGQLLF